MDHTQCLVKTYIIIDCCMYTKRNILEDVNCVLSCGVLHIALSQLLLHNTVEVCEEGNVRLVESNINGSGRVEVCLNEEWRIVGDETWGVEEATVVCRQIGLPTDGQRPI